MKRQWTSPWIYRTRRVSSSTMMPTSKLRRQWKTLTMKRPTRTRKENPFQLKETPLPVALLRMDPRLLGTTQGWSLHRWPRLAQFLRWAHLLLASRGRDSFLSEFNLTIQIWLAPVINSFYIGPLIWSCIVFSLTNSNDGRSSNFITLAYLQSHSK